MEKSKFDDNEQEVTLEEVHSKAENKPWQAFEQRIWAPVVAKS